MVVFTDDFNRASSNDIGNGWVETESSASVWRIFNNAEVQASGQAVYPATLIQPNIIGSTTPKTITVRVSVSRTGVAGNYIDVLTSYTDSSNYCGVRIGNVTGLGLVVTAFTRIAGVEAFIGSPQSITALFFPALCTVTQTGTRITFSCGATTLDVTDATFIQTGSVGLVSRASLTFFNTIDDFTLESSSPRTRVYSDQTVYIRNAPASPSLRPPGSGFSDGFSNGFN